MTLSLQARCVIVVWKKRWWVAWEGWMAEIWGCTQGVLKISKNLNLKFVVMWFLLNSLFITIGTRYSLETLSICRADVAEEFTNVFKKLQKCCCHHFLHFALFLQKNKPFSPKIASMSSKCSILLQVSHFVAFRQLESVFKFFQKMLMWTYLHFG